MSYNYTAPGILQEEFLLPKGLALSVDIVNRNRITVEGITGNSIGFDSTHIHWLGTEVDYNLLWNWFDEQNSKAEKQKLKQLMESLLSRSEGNGDIEKSAVLIDYMKELVIKYGEKFYKKMVSFDAGEREDDCGNNRMYQSSLLSGCVLLGIRLGVDAIIIERWKTKLKEEDTKYIQENIFPEKITY